MAVGMNGLESVKPSDTMYRAVSSDGSEIKTYKVPADKVEEFEGSIVQLKQALKQELGKDIEIIKIQRLF